MLSVIPKPNSFIVKSGYFDLNAKVAVKGLDNPFLLNLLNTIMCKKNEQTKSSIINIIQFEKNESLGMEVYLLNITTNRIIVQSSSESGIFYALMTLKQISSLNEKLPCCEIIDEPRYAHRGFLLDVSRHFIPKEEVKKIIDIAALFKMNKFHWHLTDDQGWRIEIKKYPDLIRNGSVRKSSVTQEYGMMQEYPRTGYYSQADIREIVRFAKERQIEIIPEIDMPGHIRSAVSAYPHLTCHQKEIEVAIEPGIYGDVLCIGNETTYEFVFNVLDEIVSLFPSNKIHLGGDEVPKSNWFSCEKCVDMIKKNHLINGQGLQTYFLNRIIKYLNDRGKQVILWNESIIDKNIDASAVCQFWNPGAEMNLIYDVIRFKNQVIDSNYKHYYLDYPYCITPLKKAYKYKSIFEAEGYSNKLLGIECAIWTDLISNHETLYDRMFPRLIAIAESSWTNKNLKDYERFKSDLHAMKDLISEYGIELSDKKLWDPKGIKCKFQALAHIKKMIKMDTIKQLRKMKKEKFVRL
jgi:hexosaminidase